MAANAGRSNSPAILSISSADVLAASRSSIASDTSTWAGSSLALASWSRRSPSFSASALVSILAASSALPRASMSNAAPGWGSSPYSYALLNFSSAPARSPIRSRISPTS